MKREKVICGIQQVGIGVPDVIEAWKWYYDNFGFELKIVDDDGVAERMLPYTGGKPQPRRAIMAFNMRGGGGFEIWQPKGRELNYFGRDVALGDYGVFAAKIKSPDVQRTYNVFKERKLNIVTDIRMSPVGLSYFFVKDPYGNLFQVEQDDYVFINNTKLVTGGSNGVIMGVSDMDKSVKFYSSLLDYDKIVYDQTDVFSDLAGLPNGKCRMRRVLLDRSKAVEGPLSAIMGTSHIELVQNLDVQGTKVYEGRLWGDPGFIHLCFDIRYMEEIQRIAESMGHPFVCDSGKDFDMGSANGHFTYIEDPDGMLIEFVETWKVPIAMGLSLNLAGKSDRKQLCPLITKAFRFTKTKRSKIK